MNSVTVKKCIGCDQVKLAASFGKCGRYLQSRCRDCRRTYRQFNAESIKRQRHQHYINNKDKANAQCKAYRQSDNYKKYTKSLRRWASSMYNSCKLRKCGASITTNDIIQLFSQQKGLCAITHRPMLLETEAWHPHRPSIDRIDNSKGYHKDNIRLVWLFVQVARCKWTDQQLIECCGEVWANNERR